MSDPLLLALERDEVVPAQFGHAEHLRCAWAFLVLIAQRLQQTRELCFEDFLAAWPELLGRELLLRHYGRAELASEEARRSFVLPTRTGPRAPAGGARGET